MFTFWVNDATTVLMVAQIALPLFPAIPMLLMETFAVDEGLTR
jgi:hypothetical protein